MKWGITFSIFIVILVLLTILKGARVVPQGQEWVIERLGKFLTVLKPGFNIIIPFFDAVRYKVDTREQVIDIQPQDVITRDNAVVTINAVAFFKVLDPPKSVYGVTNLRYAIEQLILTALRAIVGKLELDEALASRERINAELREAVAGAVDTWGTLITRVEIKDITPPREIAEAMAKQIKADREKRAIILEAEGTRQAQILQAEGRKQAQILDAEGKKQAAFLEAEARERLAQAESFAISVVGKTVKEAGVNAALYLLGEKYVKSLLDLGKSNNSKIIVFPADLYDGLKGIFGLKKAE